MTKEGTISVLKALKAFAERTDWDVMADAADSAIESVMLDIEFHDKMNLMEQKEEEEGKVSKRQFMGWLTLANIQIKAEKRFAAYKENGGGED